ncbi:hypothetical protein NDU88_005279 [Pleurodeles waltl]|uniref:Uncharacterized protein n=1 Tax=Pleurodeles waltl TaxID=8319 RepID=A0AAV7TTJ0_PLEWA|nr:hypothetical protein NDU88_005279 [Pleurodeles waltl]
MMGYEVSQIVAGDASHGSMVMNPLVDSVVPQGVDRNRMLAQEDWLGGVERNYDKDSIDDVEIVDIATPSGGVDTGCEGDQDDMWLIKGRYLKDMGVGTEHKDTKEGEVPIHKQKVSAATMITQPGYFGGQSKEWGNSMEVTEGAKVEGIPGTEGKKVKS